MPPFVNKPFGQGGGWTPSGQNNNNTKKDASSNLDEFDLNDGFEDIQDNYDNDFL